MLRSNSLRPPTCPETPRCAGAEPKPKKPKPVCSSLGNVELSELKPADREFFLAQMYRTTYKDYAKDQPTSSLGSLVAIDPFSRRDDVMLQVLNATKPNLAHYGFGLPNKCCVAWSNVQSRTLPNDNRAYLSEKKPVENPYSGYPDKMYPHIVSKELCPHYDGSFVFGYTGHQRRCLDYPADVNVILRRDFPKHIPRALTTNQAKLAYLPIPLCEKKNNPA